ncbi:bifunctional phosphopantothenoylcysteine decarboxylase/phosphopantothenate--cysteine ligase CoaBC [Azospirillum rugosum]|uniref:Coenzyme A biosynthesis bifunctional protein CoaBC n=1 Tax=Azospirillum rugosum TaxID=416170 RepID=A0ABS4SN78_9PROT|nr:bifunctional phosphopantothenoylcysteine decarboxylase/phosphopantothenate--cysteine ligase CoaBC [Azospirillum rugosum]MBP2294021.1 phosphopantothenoylcysteine decarboxylase/phosphopantothenate--cysteine ligase [Azospirillum rugosum]MDQ0526792.1 phosphopantothenoylcysteine decarboxylase/phosphopantothenate--cysteine ligase [Azospirillum rugosum]
MADSPLLSGKRILLVIAGGIAAYKSLELIRRLKERGATVRAVLTKAGAQFVTPLSVQALTEDTVYQDLWSLTDESEMGHIQLSRAADLVLVAPATANLLARMAAGMADDLAATVVLATDKPVLVAPAMNVRMWEHPATRANMRLLEERGVRRVGPNKGDMACGEYGFGRMAEPMEILQAIVTYFEERDAPKPLKGKRALVTSGPTFEPIDPVRYIANRSSGRQGHAIAAALHRLGAEVTLVTGPTRLADPPGCAIRPIETAREMLAACEAALPVDIAVCAAAVADWRVAGESDRKLKKDGGGPPGLTLTENPDILAALSQSTSQRPALVVGFAAETGNVVEYATAKRIRKGCDWIVANDVSPGTTTFGGSENTVHLIRDGGIEDWPTMGKEAVAARLAEAIAQHFNQPSATTPDQTKQENVP